MKKYVFLTVIILIISLKAENECDPELLPLPGYYEDFSDKLPQVLYENGTGRGKLRDFDFFLWLSRRLLKSNDVFAGLTFTIEDINYNWNYSRFLDFSRNGNFFREDGQITNEPGLNSSWQFNLRLFDRLWLQPELNYRNFEAEMELSDFPIIIADLPEYNNYLKMELKLRYLVIPLLLKYELRNREEFSLYFAAGPGINYFLNGRLEWHYLSDPERSGEMYKERGKTTLREREVFSFSLLTKAVFTYQHFFLEFGFENRPGRTELWENNGYLRDKQGEIDDFVLESYDYQRHKFSLKLGMNFGK